jgi:cytochrome c-type biogenesis protein CcmH/NrfG
MEAWIKILVGLVLTIVSLGYLDRPGWVIRWNEWARNLLFNDAHILHYRRRWGILIFLAATLFFYSGFSNLKWQIVLSSPGPEPVLDIWDAYRVFQAKDMKGTVSRCKEILKNEPENLHAWVLMGSAQTALGRHREARQTWKRVQELRPDRPARKAFLLEKNKNEKAKTVAAQPQKPL